MLESAYRVPPRSCREQACHKISKSRDAKAWRCTCAKWKEMNQKKENEREWERDENGMESKRVWLGSWVLGNSRRPPNELFSSLPIYFCSLFNQPPTSHSPSFFVPRFSFLRRNTKSPLSSMQQRWIHPRAGTELEDCLNKWEERKYGEGIYVVNIHDKMSNIVAIGRRSWFARF